MTKRTIGGKGLNSGIRGGLWERKHSDAMGGAVFLFGWLVHRQTTQRNGTGLVLRGKPLTYADISADTDFPESTLRRWMARLKKAGYIEVKYSLYSRMVVRILNAKKFNPRQLEFPVSVRELSRPEPHDMEPSSRASLSEISRHKQYDLTAKVAPLKEGIEFEHIQGERSCASHTPPSPLAMGVCDRLTAFWNAERGALPEVLKLTEGRRQKILTRIRKDAQFPEKFEAAVRKARQTPFCRGEGERGWRVSFDWLIANDTNAVAVLEGRYDAAKGVAVQPHVPGVRDIVPRQRTWPEVRNA